MPDEKQKETPVPPEDKGRTLPPGWSLFPPGCYYTLASVVTLFGLVLLFWKITGESALTWRNVAIPLLLGAGIFGLLLRYRR